MKILLIFFLAILPFVGMRAQEHYEFHASDYRSIDTKRAQSITTNDGENNFVVNGNEGPNNVAFGLDLSKSGSYYITPEEYWYVVKGTGLSIQAGSNSYAWWMNGFNNNSQVIPNRMLNKDGVQILAWNIKTNAGLNGKFNTTENTTLTANNTTNGYIDAIGLTSAQADNKATITLVDYMTEQEINDLFGDITSTYITNPSFEDGMNGWTLDINTSWSGVNVGGGNGDPVATDGTHIFGVWDDAAGKNAMISQNITLPAGTYKLTVDMHAPNGNNNFLRLGNQHLFCGDTKAYLSNQVTTNGQGDNYPLSTITLVFTVAEDNTTLSIGANQTTAPNQTWYKVDNFRLYTMSDDVKLSDRENLTYPVATYDKVTLTRTLKAGWNTICLPFNTPVADVAGADAMAYEFSAAEENVLSFTEVDEMEANVPYLLYCGTEVVNPTLHNVTLMEANAATVTKDDWSFIGNYTPGMNMEGKYGVTNGQVRLAGSGSTLNGMRAYFEGPSNSEAKIKVDGIDGDDDETAISTITGNETAVTYYSLDGKRLAAPAKGINIVKFNDNTIRKIIVK